MLWPFILPFQITCGVLLIAVRVLTAIASPKRWGRVTGFFLYSAIALVAFVPSCTGIMLAIDGIRFGDFSYASYGDHSAVRRGGSFDAGETVDTETFKFTFGDLRWACPSNATVYHSPSESDGGGATCYFDAANGTVFQHTGFW